MGGGCEGIHQPVPSLPGSQRLSLLDLITRPLAGKAALILPVPANQFAFPSSRGKQPHLQKDTLSCTLGLFNTDTHLSFLAHKYTKTHHKCMYLRLHTIGCTVSDMMLLIKVK